MRSERPLSRNRSPNERQGDPPFRTDLVESLLHPHEVLLVRERLAALEIEAGELRGIEGVLTMEGYGLTHRQQAATVRLTVETVEKAGG